jgi:hypothetical protein
MIQRADGDVEVDQPAQARGERRDAGGVVRRVGEDDHVGVESLAVRREEPGQVRRADLLLPLDDPPDVHGEPPARL